MRSFHSVIYALAIYCVSLFSISANADQLVLYNVPSPYGINWRSPNTLLRSVLRNHRSGQSHEIGHVFVGIYCSDLGISGEPNVLTGMTSAVDNSKELILGQGYGLGVLFHDYEGRLNSVDEALADINAGVQNGRLSFMAFDITKSTCQRLLTYELEYRLRGYDRSYGLPNRPLYGEGAGVAPLGRVFSRSLVLTMSCSLKIGDVMY